jgi:acyl-CoA synthetase (AMP-forming)/AMP-acid ligase II
VCCIELPDTIPACLARSADSEADHGVTVVDEGGAREFRSYRQLRESADRTAAALQIAGLEPGERVLLALPTGFEFLTAYFGALAAGIVPVPMPAPSEEGDEERYRRTLVQTGRRLEADALVRPVGAGHLDWPGSGLTTPFGSVTDLGELLEDVPTSVTIREPADLPATAHIQMTEGTTASPRAVEVTHRNIVRNVAAIGEALEVDDSDVGVSWIPLHNPLGLIGVVCFGVAFGIELVLIHPDRFLARPHCWLEAISRYEGTLSAAPNFAYHYAARRCRESDLEGLDLSSWRVAMSGGEPVRGQHLEAFLKRLRDQGLREDVFTPVYGLSEATIGVTVGPLDDSFVMDAINRHILEQEGRAKQLPDRGPETASERIHLMSVGEPIGEVDVRIVDEEGEPVGERILGEIAVRGPNVMEGYVDGYAERGAARLRRGWLRTGDLGYLADGRLFVVGRACDRIHWRDGRTVFPEEVEFFVDAVDGVHAGRTACFGVDDPSSGSAGDEQRLVVAFELQPGTALEDVERPLEELLQTHLALTPDEITALAPRSIPRTKSGKVRRHLARRLYRRDRLDRRNRNGRLVQLERILRRGRRDLAAVGETVTDRLASWLVDDT